MRHVLTFLFISAYFPQSSLAQMTDEQVEIVHAFAIDGVTIGMSLEDFQTKYPTTKPTSETDNSKHVAIQFPEVHRAAFAKKDRLNLVEVSLALSVVFQDDKAEFIRVTYPRRSFAQLLILCDKTFGKRVAPENYEWNMENSKRYATLTLDVEAVDEKGKKPKETVTVTLFSDDHKKRLLAEQRAKRMKTIRENFAVDMAQIGMTVEVFKKLFPRNKEIEIPEAHLAGVRMQEFHVFRSDYNEARMLASAMSVTAIEGKIVKIKAVYSGSRAQRMRMVSLFKEVLGPYDESASDVRATTAKLVWDLKDAEREASIEVRDDAIVLTVNFAGDDQESNEPKNRKTEASRRLTQKQIAGIRDFEIAGIKIGMSVGELKKLFPNASPVKFEQPEGVQGAAEKWEVKRESQPEGKMLAMSVEADCVDGKIVGLAAFYSREQHNIIVERAFESFGEDAGGQEFAKTMTAKWQFAELERTAVLISIKESKNLALIFSDGTPYFVPSKLAESQKLKF